MPGWFMQQKSTPKGQSPIGTPVLLRVSCDDTELDSIAVSRYGEPGARALRVLGSSAGAALHEAVPGRHRTYRTWSSLLCVCVFFC